jgi:hypothetical protein
MDESIWKLAQVMMCIFGIQTGILTAVISGMWWHFNKRFDKVDQRFDRIEREVQELRTSINRMEGAFYSKDCCVLKDDQQKKKAE